jgi:hypothetical protein
MMNGKYPLPYSNNGILEPIMSGGSSDSDMKMSGITKLSLGRES